ncbi:MAG: energy-coupling factor transporter transmembrane component T [Candidatus Poribacteria bacterium]|nr:energy-coupling factor transporter transmembrane component T [Candidatus Poribacteria bacterium]
MRNAILEPRTKILMMLIAGCLVILLDSPTALLVCFLGSLTLIAVSIPTWRQIGLLCTFLLFTTWGLVYSQAIFYNEFPRTVLFTLVPAELPLIGKMTRGIRVYREGLFHGIVQSLRFNTTLVIGCFIVWTTQPRDLLLALTQLRVPSTLAFMVTTALHFIPVIANEAATVLRSQRLRGFRYLRLNLLATCRGVLNSFRPILAGNIRHATYLSESVESRGFSAETMAERTSLRTLKMGVWDYGLLTVLLVCLIGIVGLKLLYFCYANGIYYGSWLRGVYTFTREVL